MPAPDLKPRVPGEAPTVETAAADAGAQDSGAAADPKAELRAELEAIVSLNAPDVIGALPTMNRDELALLRELETAGKGRVSVLGAVDEALSAGDQAAPKAPTNSAVTSADTADRPVLTDAGWVVPEPKPNG
ncbi:TPA: hypothetical protein ACN3MR_002881 [Stenotrophomonas maltophilia]